MAEKNETLTDTDREFATAVRTARESLGYSQADVAARLLDFGLEITQVTLSRIESGRRAARLGEATALAELLQIPLTRPERAVLEASLADAIHTYDAINDRLAADELLRQRARDRIWTLRELIEGAD